MYNVTATAEFRVHDVFAAVMSLPVEPLDDGAGEHPLPPRAFGGKGIPREAERPPVTHLATPQVTAVHLAPALWHFRCRN